MKVHEVIDHLTQQPQNAEVILAEDVAGKKVAPLREIGYGCVELENGREMKGVVLWPTN